MEEKSVKLVAFYSNKLVDIAFKNEKNSGIKKIQPGIWTVVEDIGNISDILNIDVLIKNRVAIHSENFRVVPPFGGNKQPKTFSVIKENTNSYIKSDSYNEYLNSSKKAAYEVNNFLKVSNFDSSKVDFSKVDFSKVDFSKVSFNAAKVYEINFSEVDISKLDFSKVDLSNTTTKSSFANVDFSKISWKSGSDEQKNARWGSINIQLLNSSAYSFSNVDFNKSDFSLVNFNGLSFEDIDLKNYPTARVSDTKNIFKDLNYTNVNFNGINFSKVDFLKNIFEFSGQPTQLGVGYKVDLTEVDFSNLDFTKVDFSKLEFID